MKAISLKEKVYGKNHPSLAEPISNLGMIKRNLNKFEEAEDKLLLSIDII